MSPVGRKIRRGPNDVGWAKTSTSCGPTYLRTGESTRFRRLKLWPVDASARSSLRNHCTRAGAAPTSSQPQAGEDAEDLVAPAQVIGLGRGFDEAEEHHVHSSALRPVDGFWGSWQRGALPSPFSCPSGNGRTSSGRNRIPVLEH